jgi:hypothetical protein
MTEFMYRNCWSIVWYCQYQFVYLGQRLTKISTDMSKAVTVPKLLYTGLYSDIREDFNILKPYRLHVGLRSCSTAQHSIIVKQLLH